MQECILFAEIQKKSANLHRRAAGFDGFIDRRSGKIPIRTSAIMSKLARAPSGHYILARDGPAAQRRTDDGQNKNTNKTKKTNKVKNTEDFENSNYP